MQTVWKFPFSTVDWVEFPMPEGARIVHVEVQHGEPCMWAVVDSDAPKALRKFRIYGTGHPMDDVQQTHVGSYTLRGGDLVFHVFEEVVG